ncbi:Beta-hexosaminidase [Candidatus Sodalis pierantonius str. SOPE]|uniref:beta-N-acetylhexosaminidase n=1 Tax=Candidatus Sodalis pierantonii str. SOPE TaxID=2342 RepID=W0HNP2_9GAMM|nr:glycoside hydrolase family 3 protein [Candidatus Sodalis pierantonius]AHF73830.1 Beta-hexosaminidase [Candidatus Sodalis pierantonius str. SOPE]
MDIKQKIGAMTLEEKIGQKIMLDFRYWDSNGNGKRDMIAPDEAIAKIIRDNGIGGVILFANNLKNKAQIQTLTDWYAGIHTDGDIHLFIGTDNEGGNVFRLPRSEYVAFPNNMTLAAAWLGGTDKELAREQAQHMASDLRALSINVNFAPIVDVNTNPFNPVINVRSFSDDVATVITLAESIRAGMHQQQMITVYKHFPGHGATSTDSHTALPRVDRDCQEAFAIDIAPYQHAIASDTPPEMIMTAHIQYPELDDTRVRNRNGVDITVPVTMSRCIQTDILRNQLGFTGVTLSDALDMGAITDHFNPDDALERVFTAGVDIALMPVSVASPAEAQRLSQLIALMAQKVKQGVIKEGDIDASVARILTLKRRYHLLEKGKERAPQPAADGQALEKRISARAITVVINQQSTLPLKDKTQRYFVLTPWAEQARGIAAVMSQEGYLTVEAAKETNLTDAEIKARIARCDVFMLGTLSTAFSPVERAASPYKPQPDETSDRYLAWLRFAAAQGKKRLHLSLRAPYDIVNFAAEVDAAVASYSYYGYDNGVWGSHAMISLAEVLIGQRSPQGKLPVNTWHHYDVKTNSGTLAYPRGFGLSW